jgi:hypothetical protein
LATGHIELLANGTPEHIAAYIRRAGDEAVLTAVNFGREDQRLRIEAPAETTWTHVLGDPETPSDEGTLTLHLRPGEALVLSGDDVAGPVQARSGEPEDIP